MVRALKGDTTLSWFLLTYITGIIPNLETLVLTGNRINSLNVSTQHVFLCWLEYLFFPLGLEKPERLEEAEAFGHFG